jgi:acetyl esterase/lipase
MIDDVNEGHVIFYRFYSEHERQVERDKTSTGLFFFRGKPDAPFAVICPGGGFSYVASLHEGFPYAMELSKRGGNAFVLQYRVDGGGTSAIMDLAAALSFIFTNADAFGVSTTGYSLWGSSAGARMVANIGSYGAARFGGGDLPKPSAVIMAYTGHSDFSRDDPPTFAVVGDRDGIASDKAMENRIRKMRASGIDTAINIFPNVGHGFGLGVGTNAEGWIDAAVEFWRQHP